MIGYVTVGSSDLERSARFFDAVLSELGAKQQWSNERMIVWGGNGPSLMACTPYDEKPTSIGNGTMVALAASDQDHVQKVYEIALANGGTDEGGPGFRGPEEMGFYGAYFRDPDGNKFCAFCVVSG